MTDISGRTYFPLFKPDDQLSAFSKTFMATSLGLDQVLSDLEGEGYATRPFIVPACAIDAPHRRDRLWIIGRNVAYANSDKHNREVAREPDETQRDEKTSQAETPFPPETWPNK